MRRNAQTGFSLVELLVAMVVTVFVVGAMFGLLTSGQSAFKTQPERTDRQQNIRSSMDLIMRDVGAAGIGMPTFMQVFAMNKDNIGPATAATVAGEQTDQLSIIANTEGFENEIACKYPGGNSTELFMMANATKVISNEPVLVIMTDGTWTIRYVTSDPSTNSGGGGQNSPCKGTPHMRFQFTAGKAQDPSGMNQPGGLCEENTYGNAHVGVDGTTPSADDDVNGTCAVAYVSMGDIVEYRICVPGLADCVAGEAGVPNLERRVNASAWQVLARGIEDMQVQYVQSDAAATVLPGAPQVKANDYSTLTAQVRVTLSARGSAGQFQGATKAVNAAQGPMAIRASLTSQASPRMALWSLSEQPSPQPAALPWN
jgi:type II secretory pathway pseudopilin PulG